MKQFYVFSISILIAFQSCRFPDYYLEKQDFNTVFKKAVKKLRGRKKKAQHLQALETAYFFTNEHDLKSILSLKEKNDRKSWERINAIHKNMLWRNESVLSLEPLVSEDGFEAKINMLPAKEWEEESYWRMVDLYLEEINENMELAYKGQKIPARNAYYLLDELQNKHGWIHEDTETMMDACLKLGTVNILLEIADHSNDYEGTWALRYLRNRNYNKKNIWKQIHLVDIGEINYDYFTTVHISQAFVSNEQVNVSTECVSREVEVGKKEIRDTSDKVTYEPVYKKVSATIYYVELSKDAELLGELRIFDTKLREEIYTRKLWDNECFRDSYCYFSGDSRAVDGNCKCFRDDDFPSDSEMIEESAWCFYLAIKKQLRKLDAVE